MPAWAGICRVTTTGSDFNDGSSWATPVSLNQALIASSICTEIWVAKGVYKPGATVNGTFSVAPNVAVYGGFVGTETARTQRNSAVNLTVLSGDVDNNDTTDANGIDVDATHIVGNNANHVISLGGNQSIGANTVLDGFTITGGNANSSDFAMTAPLGGGLVCSGSHTGYACSPSLSNLRFIGNRADFSGGAVYNDGIAHGASSPTFTNVTFSGNFASAVGGAVYNSGVSGVSSPSFTNVTFSNNRAGKGGAIYNDGTADLYDDGPGDSSPTFSNVTFSGNSATDSGGAIYSDGTGGASNPTFDGATFSGNTATNNGGAICLSSSPAVLNNVTFNGNVANSYGGAIFDTSATLKLTNATFSANKTYGWGGAINIYSDATLIMRNAILWGDQAPLGQGPELSRNLNNTVATIDHSIVQGSGGSAAWNSDFGTDGGGNLDADPRLGALAYNRGTTQTMLPSAGSPAIDAGNDSVCPSADQRGIVRPQGAHCDIGAVETFIVDLIGHKGFEGCWSKALSKSSFLARIQSKIDGATTCVAPFTGAGYAACNTAACSGGATGCPVTTHASAFTDGGNFNAGNFNATGSFDPLFIPVVTASGSCTVQVYLAGNWTPEYVLTGDGNFGDYAALLNRLGFTLTTYSAVGNSIDCQAYASGIGLTLMGLTQSALASKVRDVTAGQSVCPLSP